MRVAPWLVWIIAAAFSQADLVSSGSWSLLDIPVQLAAQNEFFTRDIPCGAEVGEVISISGNWFLQVGAVSQEYPDGVNGKEFPLVTVDEVKCQLGRFLGQHANPPGGFAVVDTPQGCGGLCPLRCRVSYDTRTIIMDIEKPHLSDLHLIGNEWWDMQRWNTVNAFKKRVAAANAVFPSAKLGLYGTLVPDGRGIATDTYNERVEALRLAHVVQGLFDGTDYLVPILYGRFGCDDDAATQCPVCDPAWGRIDEMTQQGIDGSRTIDPSRPLLPIVGFGIINSNSCFNRKLFLDLQVEDKFEVTLATQIDILRANAAGTGSGGPISKIVLWAGRNQDLLEPYPAGAWKNPHGRTVQDYTNRLCP
jgi:hypothetical protein